MTAFLKKKNSISLFKSISILLIEIIFTPISKAVLRKNGFHYEVSLHSKPRSLLCRPFIYIFRYNIPFTYAKTKAQISCTVTMQLISILIFSIWAVGLLSLSFLIRNFRPFSSSIAVQPGLCLTWSEAPKRGFLVMRLKDLLMGQAIGIKTSRYPDERYSRVVTQLLLH